MVLAEFMCEIMTETRGRSVRASNKSLQPFKFGLEIPRFCNCPRGERCQIRTCHSLKAVDRNIVEYIIDPYNWGFFAQLSYCGPFPFVYQSLPWTANEFIEIYPRTS